MHTPLSQDLHETQTRSSVQRDLGTPRVAVVGAGIAGLICARTLADRHMDVSVFDKGRHPGGRISTRRVDSRFAFDHGAQYFTARDPHFIRIVESWRQQGLVQEWQGRIVQLQAATAVESTPQVRFVGVPGMSAIAAYLASQLFVRQNTRIVAAKRVGRHWELIDETGVVYGPFDDLVIGLPAPQVTDVLPDHTLATEIANVVMEPCWAVLVAFSHRVEVPWDGAFVSNSPLSWVARNSSKPSRPSGADCWVLHAGTEWSAGHIEESPERVSLQLVEGFEAAIGRTLPPAIYRSAHRWRYSRGAYPLERNVLHDSHDRLAICGDWLAGGRVEGAFLSGIAAAHSVGRMIAIPDENAN